MSIQWLSIDDWQVAVPSEWSEDMVKEYRKYWHNKQIKNAAGCSIEVAQRWLERQRDCRPKLELWAYHEGRGLICPICKEDHIQSSTVQANRFRCHKCEQVVEPVDTFAEAIISSATKQLEELRKTSETLKDYTALIASWPKQKQVDWEAHCHRFKGADAPFNAAEFSGWYDYNSLKDNSENIDGLKVSTIPPFHLVPRIAYERLAKRVALGEQTKGKDAWNAFSDNQEVLLSRKALARRLGHAIDHATKMLADLAEGRQTCMQDDDAAALCWAGMYAICASDAQQKEEECQPTSSPSVSNSSEASLLSALRNLSATPATELPRADQHKVLLQFKTEKDKQIFFTAWHKLQSQQDKSTSTNNSSPATE